MKQTQAWQCSHCNMVSLYKANVKRHESKSCQKAPGSCGTCRHFLPNDGPDTVDYCEKKDAELWDGKRTQCDAWEEQGQ